MKVEGHVQTLAGARSAIDAGIWSIAHSTALNDEMHKLMAQKGIWRAGTETPQGLAGHPVTDAAYRRTVDGLKNAYDNKGAADVSRPTPTTGSKARRAAKSAWSS
jgi:imidazolonepropionase-like amidohydrolase